MIFDLPERGTGDGIRAMKINMSNPWVSIRWAVVVFIFLFEVFVARDQVKTQDARIAELEGEAAAAGKKARAAIRLAEEVTNKGLHMSESAISGLVKVQSGLTEVEGKGRSWENLQGS